jgi:PII-like signaling protein
MIETVIRKRIEILVDTALVRRITDAIDKAQITGWSVLPVTSGSGRDGRWREERVLGTDKSLVLSIASAEKAEQLVAALSPMLNTHGLLLTMWNVEVIRGERF